MRAYKKISVYQINKKSDWDDDDDWDSGYDYDSWDSSDTDWDSDW